MLETMLFLQSQRFFYYGSKTTSEIRVPSVVELSDICAPVQQI